jgi:predicted nucleotidyltransferase
MNPAKRRKPTMGIQERWRGFEPLPRDTRARLDLLSRLFQETGVLLAYLFGSFPHEEDAADIDLAVLPGEGGLGDLREKITELLDTQRVDLVNLKTAAPVFRFEVVRTGVLIFKKSDLVENSYELSALREYRDTARLRTMQAEMLEERNRRWS